MHAPIINWVNSTRLVQIQRGDRVAPPLPRTRRNACIISAFRARRSLPRIQRHRYSRALLFCLTKLWKSANKTIIIAKNISMAPSCESANQVHGISKSMVSEQGGICRERGFPRHCMVWSQNYCTTFSFLGISPRHGKTLPHWFHLQIPVSDAISKTIETWLYRPISSLNY